MNQVLLHGKMKEIPTMSFLPDENTSKSVIGVCRGTFVCQIEGKKEYYPVFASGKTAARLMEVARTGLAFDVTGYFRHFCWENRNMERHMSYYILVNAIYCIEKEMPEMPSGNHDRSGDITQLMREQFLIPIDLMRYEDLISKLYY